MEQKITALDLLNCQQDALYYTFMQATKGFRFINRKTKKPAFDRAVVYWSVCSSDKIREALYVIADGTDDRWEMIKKRA